jgi:8-oxo-dGTP pyrophosphatase MutT (NUDIX family)
VSRPGWVEQIADAARRAVVEDFSPVPAPPGGRASAVLVLFGEQAVPGAAARPDVLLIERAFGMRSHAGQPAFPGGAVDVTDDGPVTAALREAAEETGLDVDGVEVLAQLPDLWLPPSGFVVTPVVAWWARPSPVSVVDASEVASVHRVPLDELLDPAARLQVRHPSGYVGPAFSVRGLLVWGFTAGLLSRLLSLAGLDSPWDTRRVEDLPAGLLRAQAGGGLGGANRRPA